MAERESFLLRNIRIADEEPLKTFHVLNYDVNDFGTDMRIASNIQFLQIAEIVSNSDERLPVDIALVNMEDSELTQLGEAFQLVISSINVCDG